MKSRRWIYGLAAGIALAVFASPSNAQAPFECLASAGVPPTARAEGLTEPLGDIVLSCSGGIPNTVGSTVRTADITLSANTNITSRELAAITGGGNFSEALLLVDEPNTLAAGNGILNCGHPGTTPSAPGVCPIVSTGNPAQTYDGTAGHPNAFQGRVGTPTNPAQINAVTFLNVPLDPPGTGSRTLRFTNLRANAATLSVLGKTAVDVNISILSSTGVGVGSPLQTVAYISTGMRSSVAGVGTATPRITLSEGFAYSFKPRNISSTVGDNDGTPGNASYSGTWLYNAGTNYPADDAQNVPSVVYDSETGFEWLNNTTNAPPVVNPPLGYGPAVPNLGNPFSSGHTGIQTAGRADAGMRVAIQFLHIPPGATVTVPEVVYLHNQGCTASCTDTGVMVLTAANAAGGGAFSRSAVTALHAANNIAVYEILYANPSSLEYATVHATVSPSGAAGPITETVSLAPFHSIAAGGQPSATLAIPRFVMAP